MTCITADLYDKYGDQLQIAAPLFRGYGAMDSFNGLIRTVKVFEDNVLVRAALAEPGAGAVLVVDGGASLRCALVGDQMAQLGADNGWSGIILNGCIRDAKVIAGISIGIKALNTNPAKSVKRGEGQRDIPVRFADVNFHPGEFVYSDTDGIVLSKQMLHIP